MSIRASAPVGGVVSFRLAGEDGQDYSYKRFWRNTMCFSSQREGFISSSSLNRSLNNNYCSLMASTTKNGQNLNSKFTGATLLVVQRNFIYWQRLTDFAWFCQIHSSPVGLLFTFWLVIWFPYHVTQLLTCPQLAQLGPTSLSTCAPPLVSEPRTLLQLYDRLFLNNVFFGEKK